MRPDGLEAIRAVQTGLAEVIVPELQSPFAQDTAQMLNMLLESIAGEWDGRVADLRRDNETITTLLSRLRDVVQRSDVIAGGFISEIEAIDDVLPDVGEESALVSDLAARNRRLSEVLEPALQRIEDVISETGHESLGVIRADIYRHLRDVAGRGWSFWDMASFWEYMPLHRAGSAG